MPNRARLAFALAVLSAAGITACNKSPTSPAPVPTPQTPTNFGQRSTGPIAFVSTRDGSPHIYLANADGSNATRLTAGEKPAWSRDGRRLAFQRSGAIYAINADGSGEMFLGSGGLPSWSPDGRIAFNDGASQSGGIFVMNADGSGRTLILSHQWAASGFGGEGCACWPSWSPDGRNIAFVRANYDDPWELSVVAPDGSTPRRVAGGAGDSEPVWQDSTALIFQSFSGIVGVNLDGSGQRSLYSGQAFDPDWSREGLLFNKFTSPAGDQISSLGSRMRIFIATGGSDRQIVPNADASVPQGYWDSQAVWAPGR
jgi:dipeptidyl aminopeptidase/acylaminoacyl peptidase